MRLIDADNIIEKFNRVNGRDITRPEAIKIVNESPTVSLPDFKEGYKQAIRDGKANCSRPQGEWIEGENGCIKCDQCGAEIIYSYFIGNEPDFPKFCCDCGADMRQEAEE